ncbi:hypothetical protein FACS1894178_1550 [Bacteroidia bacterium]|nr:hypothetical protein FACS1894178_1550 [Bacteroidia bacterium]
MKKIMLLSTILALFACKNNDNIISQKEIDKVINNWKGIAAEASLSQDAIFRIERGVKQVAALWEKTDGTKDDFIAFCNNYFISHDAELESYFNKLEKNLETLKGFYNKISVDLKLPLHLNTGELEEIDEIFGALEPSSHFNEDMFANKIAFITLLNFPTYTLEEKNTLGKDWTRRDWAYARVGDIFTSRVPAELSQEYSTVLTAADSYISDYNIMMGNLVNDKGERIFPADLKLISHWGLRDELKSQYALGGLEQQRMIYQVMAQIISQQIPVEVVNNPNVLWNPYTNLVSKDGKTFENAAPEAMARYQMMLDNCNVLKKIDKYQPAFPTYIDANFNAATEISKEDVENIFVELLSSPQVKKVAEMIKKRLGRDLEPFDIWYNGFAARANSNEKELDKQIAKKYPNVDAFEKDLPNLLVKLGFSKEKATYICSKVKVDGSRGAGHAWGSEMKGDKARLRTRIGNDGMNFKGYNIAVHEFGHNVEQTLSLYDVDYYSLHGVPNTAFTEALAFVFQKRDMFLLNGTAGQTRDDIQGNEALDVFWNAYEIMGVSLVDIKVWEWLYSQKNPTKEQLSAKVQDIAKEVWNLYYAPIFGAKDQTVLAIYSHMIDYPLYLSNYPMGHLIEFQLEEYLRGKDFAKEMERIFTLGRLTPKYWMLAAVGCELSVKPLLNAVDKAIE